MNKEKIKRGFEKLQDEICEGLEDLDQKGKFIEDLWDRNEGGGGRSRVITDGNLIEKGGVNFSAVSGDTPEKILSALNLQKAEFFATGVSIVLHPVSPMVPIIHMNVRYFEMSNGVYWFGGGIDLTPHYVQTSNAGNFHKILKDVCDKYSAEFYPKFKQWADDYFFIKHRKETRGIGGIFFDRLTEENTSLSKSELWSFVIDVGSSFVNAYKAGIGNSDRLDYSDQEKRWQHLRRGRYVEFNLVLDKGTKFGLDTNGRTESILMSMPPAANWEYNYLPEPGSKEGETLQYLKKGINWTEYAIAD